MNKEEVEKFNKEEQRRQLKATIMMLGFLLVLLAFTASTRSNTQEITQKKILDSCLIKKEYKTGNSYMTCEVKKINGEEVKK